MHWNLFSDAAYNASPDPWLAGVIVVHDDDDDDDDDDERMNFNVA